MQKRDSSLLPFPSFLAGVQFPGGPFPMPPFPHMVPPFGYADPMGGFPGFPRGPPGTQDMQGFRGRPGDPKRKGKGLNEGREEEFAHGGEFLIAKSLVPFCFVGCKRSQKVRLRLCERRSVLQQSCRCRESRTMLSVRASSDVKNNTLSVLPLSKSFEKLCQLILHLVVPS